MEHTHIYIYIYIFIFIFIYLLIQMHLFLLCIYIYICVYTYAGLEGVPDLGVYVGQNKHLDRWDSASFRFQGSGFVLLFVVEA